MLRERALGFALLLECWLAAGVRAQAVAPIPADISVDTALVMPADALGTAYLKVQTLLLACPLAKAGATIEDQLDGRPVVITSDNVLQVERSLKRRRDAYARAIRQRGSARLAAGYAASTHGPCDDLEIGAVPTLVEQDGCDLFLTQGPLRHMGVVVESRVIFRHDSDTSMIVTGTISDGGVVFDAPIGSATGAAADGGCTLTLTPAPVEGPDWAMALVGRAMAHRSYARYEEMFADIDRALALDRSARIAGLQAYLLATCPQASLRDGKRAVAAAELARTLAGGEVDLDLAISLAVAHAEAGDFTSAVAWQKRVVDLVPEESKPEQREHLRAFEARQPFHEPAPF